MEKLYDYFDNLTDSEEALDEHIYIRTSKQAEEIKLHEPILLMLCASCSGKPEMLLIDQSDKNKTIYHFPLYQGFQVHICNEFLRSLDTGIDIEFVTYKQYAELIDKCFDVIHQ